MLLLCQALQPSEICSLRWCDLNFTANTLLVVRDRSKSLRLQPQIVVKLLEVDADLAVTEVQLAAQLQSIQ